LEILDFALVPLRGVQRFERPQIAPAPRLRVLLDRVEAIAAGFELADHRGFPDIRRARQVCRLPGMPVNMQHACRIALRVYCATNAGVASLGERPRPPV